jgi:hypothetical protein
MAKKGGSKMSDSTSLNTQAVLSMKGSGYYSARTIGAKHAIETTLPLMLSALDSLPNLPVLKLADYGAADGGTSQYMWSKLISGIRASGDNRPIEIIYTDLASNDFSTLFRTMQGMQGNSDDAYQILHDNVFVHGCGTGFHQQLMAPDTLSLGFSATAMHYVSEKPCQITDHVHMVGANTKERAEFTRQAARDWERILLGRAAELAKGGRFICMNFGIDEEGRYLGHTGGMNMFDRFSAHWAALRDGGVISSDEFVKATFAQHYRTVEEFTAPFSDPSSSVSKAGLKLLSVNTRLTPCPFRLAYDKSEGKMSSAEFAATLIPTMRSWSETVFRTALEGRAENEIDTIIDQFYGAYEIEVAGNPDGHAMDYIHIILEIEKA